MVSDPVLATVLTVLFAATGAYAVLRIVVDRRRPFALIGDVLHVVMSAAMIGMCQSGWSAVPLLPQVVVFSVAALWFAVVFILRQSGRIAASALGGHGAGHQAAHAVMMLAMVWMALSMSAGSMDMSSMDMGAMDAESADGHQHGALPLWASLSGIALVAALIVAAVLFLTELIRILREGDHEWEHIADAAAGAAMSAGMAAMCGPMIAG